MADTGAFRAPKLGIGMTFAAALRPFLERRPGALDVFEVEPQTLWIADDAFKGPFFEFTPAIDMLAALPGAKLVHSVGMPLGGARQPEPAQMELIRTTAERLDSPWVSEHLSIAGTPHRAAGFLLPPLQTDEGVATAVANIRAFSAGVRRPVAVETGVAYLKRQPFEMEDGDYLRAVAETADCGLLLDLHNLYCNARNGRIDLDRTLAQIPLDRVWEVHLAGGDEDRGIWLDSHSGPMPAELAAIAAEVLPSLPNLGAINFEVYDTYLARLDQSTFDRIVDSLRPLWECAGRAASDALPPRPATASTPAPVPDLAAWEEAVTDAVWKNDPALYAGQPDWDALALYTRLARSFRGSMLARCLPRTLRYLLLRDGTALEKMMAAYFTAVDAPLYAPLEARAFALWLREGGEADPLALSLLDYDMAFLKIVREGKPQVVRFPGNPGPVFEALAEARLPDLPAPPAWEMEILPDGFTVEDFAAHAGGS